MHRYWLITGCLIAGFIGVTGCPAPARAAGGYEACTAIDDDALRLRCYDQLDYVEIAARTRTTPARARIHFHRAKKSLKERLACCV